MAIKPLSEKPVREKIEIDLTGPEGNAYVLMGHAKSYAKRIGIDSEPILKDMQSGDYDHLLEVFDKHFGHFVNLYR
jgi:hypothetical protein